jgi:hypothetical protein
VRRGRSDINWFLYTCNHMQKHISSCVHHHMYLIDPLAMARFVLNSVCVVGNWAAKRGIYFGQHLCICPGAGMVALLALKVGGT